MEKLSPTSLEQLEKFLPEDRIINKYQELKENIDELDNAEQFLVIVSLLLNLSYLLPYTVLEKTKIIII